MNADRTGVARLTNTTTPEYAPAWSPDGYRVAFVSHRTGFPELHVMNPDGTNPTALTSIGVNDDKRDPDWSPDGKKLVFAKAVGTICRSSPPG